MNTSEVKEEKDLIYRQEIHDYYKGLSLKQVIYCHDNDPAAPEMNEAEYIRLKNNVFMGEACDRLEGLIKPASSFKQVRVVKKNHY